MARTAGPALTAVAVAVAAVCAAVSGYPSGAPGKDCWTDRPLHGNHLPAHHTPPYEIVLTKMDPQADLDTYSPGEMINVTIRSRDGTPFRGYLMKVYGSNGVSRGVWGARKRQQHVLKRCGVTHDNNTVETQVSILWVAPKVPVMDNIQFKAIVVRNYTIFYNNILSRPLKPNYPSLSFDKIFQRLVAFANMNFNISLPTIPLPDPKMTSVLDLPKVTDTSVVKDTAIEVKDTSRATDSAVKVTGSPPGPTSSSVVQASGSNIKGS